MNVIYWRSWWIAWLLVCICWVLPLRTAQSELRPCPIEPTQQTTQTSTYQPPQRGIWNKNSKRWIAIAGVAILLFSIGLASLQLLILTATLGIDFTLIVLWLLGLPLGSIFGIMACIQLIDSTYITGSIDPQTAWHRALMRGIWSMLCGLLILPTGIVLGGLIANAGLVFLLVAALFLGAGLFGIILARPRHDAPQQYE